MNYSDGLKVMKGDVVSLWNGAFGVVVCDFENGIFSEQYNDAEWKYIKDGVLVESEKAGLIHLVEPNEDLKLVEREN